MSSSKGNGSRSLDMRKSSIDLLNVDYDDVLQLYRGWRRAEGLVKDKDKELAQMHTRIEQLQESHTKFRNRIEALNGVKELTITLQSNCNVLYQENLALTQENKNLENKAKAMEEEMQRRDQQMEEQNKLLHDAETELNLFKGRFDQLSNSHMELEKIASEEQATRLSAEARLNSMEELVSNMREENSELNKQLDANNIRMAQCDQEVAQASEQLVRLAKEVAFVTAKNERYINLESENALLRGDIARILRLVGQSAPSNESGNDDKRFKAAWKDSEGMSFIGLEKPKNYDKKAASAGKSKSMDLKDFDDSDNGLDNFYEVDEGNPEIDEEEMNSLREQHGGDPFPLAESLRKEQESWVPREAAVRGLSFFAARLPNAPHHILHEFLRSVNKVWLKREKRKLKRVKETYLSQIQDLKRQIQHQKPYRGVIAERRIRMLKNQVDREREKKLHGRPLIRNAEDDWEEDIRDAQEGPRDQLLHASLSTLETLGRHNITSSDSNLSYKGTGKTGAYPPELYLQGALWLGRNFVMLSEEMVEQMEFCRSKVLREITAIGEDDTDPQRSYNRISLLAGSAVTESVEITAKYKYRAREMLHGAASIKPGDYNAMQLFLQNLPIDSLLDNRGNLSTSYGAYDKYLDNPKSSLPKHFVFEGLGPMPDSSIRIPNPSASNGRTRRSQSASPMRSPGPWK